MQPLNVSVDLPLSLGTHDFLCLCGLGFEWYIHQANSMNNIITIPTRVRSSLTWWKDPERVCVRVSFLSRTPNKTIIMDVFLIICGAHLNSHMTQGTWTSQEDRIHISLLKSSGRMRSLQSLSTIHPVSPCIHVRHLPFSSVLSRNPELIGRQP